MASDRLRRGAEAIGVALDESMLRCFARYLELLTRWNARINLTSIEDPLEIIDRHFLDSLTIVHLLKGSRTLVDIGSGAGFPGAAVAIACPGLQVTCVESIHKKVAFLQTLRRELGLSLEPLPLRDDQLGDRTFDAAVSRATWDPPAWLEHGAGKVVSGGLLIAMQSEPQSATPLKEPPGFSTIEPRWFDIAGARRKIQGFRRG